jgi:hypothetical protein
MELFPEFFTVDVEDELPESFTLPPVAVTTFVFRFVLVLLPPVAVDVELPPVAVFLFVLLLEFELEF